MIEDEEGFVPLFDGTTLTGWHSEPRIFGPVWPGGPSSHPDGNSYGDWTPDLATRHQAVWRVEDGVIIGEQDAPGSGFGGYLVSDAVYGDFELRLEMNPDWPADTGVMLRRRAHSLKGLQVLVDHRKSGSIGGFYGNDLAGFHAVPFVIDAELDAGGALVRLIEEDPATSIEPFTPHKRSLLSRAATAEDFLAVWRSGEWNELRVRCVGGPVPVLTTWINGVLVAELDVSRVEWPGFSADMVRDELGDSGHLAFEVHDNDRGMGYPRWGVGAACRWRNIRIKEL